MIRSLSDAERRYWIIPKHSKPKRDFWDRRHWERAKMAMAFVQSSSANGFSGPITTGSLNITNGNIFAIWAAFTTGTVTGNGVSCTAGSCTGGFQTATSVSNGSRTGLLVYGVATATQATTFTFTVSSGTQMVLIVHEISGGNTTTPLDNSLAHINDQTSPGTGTDLVTSTNILTTKNGDYIFGATWDYGQNGPVWTKGTNFNQRVVVASGGARSTMSEDQVQSSSGNIAATFTSSIAFVTTITGVMAFQPASSASVVPQINQNRRGNFQAGMRGGFSN